jgi:hypothetical protein
MHSNASRTLYPCREHTAHSGIHSDDHGNRNISIVCALCFDTRRTSFQGVGIDKPTQIVPGCLFSSRYSTAFLEIFVTQRKGIYNKAGMGMGIIYT